LDNIEKNVFLKRASYELILKCATVCEYYWQNEQRDGLKLQSNRIHEYVIFYVLLF